MAGVCVFCVFSVLLGGVTGSSGVVGSSGSVGVVGSSGSVGVVGSSVLPPEGGVVI